MPSSQRSTGRPARPSRFTRAVVPALLPATALVLFNAAHADTVKFDFELKVTQFIQRADDIDPEPRVYNVNGRVVLDLRTHAWLLHFPELANAEQVTLCDGGTNAVTYLRIRYPDVQLSGRYALMSSPQTIEDGGPIMMTVNPTAHPWADFATSLSWMAWLSSDYLGSPRRLMPLPGQPLSLDYHAFGFQDSTETFADALGMPRRIDFVVSKALMKKAPLAPTIPRAGGNSTRVKLWLRPDFSGREGDLLGEYKVVDSKLINGLNVTTGFHYTGYAAKPDGHPRKTLETAGLASNFETGIPLTLPATFQGHTNFAVNDLRFRSSSKCVDQITYVQTNWRVQPITAPRLQAQYESELSKAKSDPVLLIRYWFHAFLTAGVAVAVLGTAAWWHVRKKCQGSGRP